MANEYEQELETQNKALLEENKRLKARTEDVLLLGLIAEGISEMDAIDSILQYALERISLIKGMPYCAFCELLDNEAFILYSHFEFERDDTTKNEIVFPESVVDALRNGVQIYSGDELQTTGIALTQKGSTFSPLLVILIPFTARIIQQGLLIIADDDLSQDKLSPDSNLFTRVINVLINRLDNLSLVQELQHLNLALNMEVDHRAAELRETNQQLRETMLQRLRVEDALLRQRDIITNIAEASPVGITILDTQGQINYANERAETVLGLSKSQITGRQYNSPEWKITDYEGNPLPESELPFARVMTTGHPVYNVQHAIEWPDGRRVLLAINAAPLFDDEFRLDGMVAVIDDVTEEIAADAEFRRLQNFNADIVRNISEGIIVEDANGIITFINPATAIILGYGPEELIGKHIFTITPQDQREISRSANQRRIQGLSDQYEIDVLRKDGVRVPILVSASPRTDAITGAFLGSLAVFTNITERKATEEMLQESEARFRGLSEATFEAIFISANGICLEQNAAAERMFGYTLDEAVGRHGIEWIAPEDRDLAKRNMLSGYEEPYEVTALRKDGTTFPAEIRGRTAQYKGKKVRVTALRDITGRKYAEEQLRQRADQLALINDIGEKVAAVLDLETVLSRTARLIQENFNYEQVALFLIDRQNNVVTMKTNSGVLNNLQPLNHSLKLGQGLVGYAALQNKTILANDVDTDARYVNLYPDIVQTRAELSVPIQIGREVVGVIDAQSEQRNAFTESDIIVMETLADQVAIAIHNANLHEAVQRELKVRTRVETALRESEKKFRNIVESSPMGMFTYQLEPDNRLVLLDANPASDLILGVDCTQFIGKTIEEAFPALTETEIPYRYRLAAATGEPWYYDQIDYDENGISGAFEIFAFQTEINRMAVFFLDVTERKQAEEALRRSENTLSSIFRVAPTGIGLIIENKILQVNQRVCEMISYEREELLGLDIRAIFPTDHHFEYYERELDRQITEKGSCTIETRWQCKDPRIIDVLFSITPIELDDLSMGLTFTALDISERKLSEARIQRQLRRLAALNQIDAAITGNVGLDRTIDILIEQTVYQLAVDAVSILLYKPATQTLEYYAGKGFNTETIKTANIRLGQDFAGRAALDRETVFATDAEPSFLTTDDFADEGFRCYYGVPLITKGEVKGVLEVFHRSMLDPTEGWLSFLETLAGQAAIAIDGSELVDTLERSNIELRLAYNNTLEGWAKALELRDFETRGHSNRVTELTIKVAQAVGISEDELVHVQRGSLLHDIGKMAVPDQILLKDGPLDDEEWGIMHQHPVYAYEMLSSIEFLRPALEIPYYHHEKWDGSGYPHGLKGEAIPLSARVFAIIDVWDALSSDRPYRKAHPRDKVLDYIRSQVGTHFDPRVAEAFFSIIEQE